MEFLALLDWNCLWLFLLGIAAFIISTLGGGGGALVMLPASNILIGVGSTPQVLNAGTLISRPSRLYLYWKNIRWKVVAYYVPSSVVGAVLGAWIFSGARVEWLQLVVGVFLISTLFQYRFGKKSRSFHMSLKYFVPLGFGISFLSTLIGAMGPVLNPFYLNAGIDKEAMIGTKTANSLLMGLVQIGSYSVFGSMSPLIWIYALSLGAGAIAGNFIGKAYLSSMSSKAFRIWVLIILVVSGISMIIGVLFNN